MDVLDSPNDESEGLRLSMARQDVRDLGNNDVLQADAYYGGDNCLSVKVSRRYKLKEPTATYSDVNGLDILLPSSWGVRTLYGFPKLEIEVTRQHEGGKFCWKTVKILFPKSRKPGKSAEVKARSRKRKKKQW